MFEFRKPLIWSVSIMILYTQVLYLNTYRRLLKSNFSVTKPMYLIQLARAWQIGGTGVGCGGARTSLHRITLPWRWRSPLHVNFTNVKRSNVPYPGVVVYTSCTSRWSIDLKAKLLAQTLSLIKKIVTTTYEIMCVTHYIMNL